MLHRRLMESYKGKEIVTCTSQVPSNIYDGWKSEGVSADPYQEYGQCPYDLGVSLIKIKGSLHRCPSCGGHILCLETEKQRSQILGKQITVSSFTD